MIARNELIRLLLMIVLSPVWLAQTEVGILVHVSQHEEAGVLQGGGSQRGATVPPRGTCGDFGSVFGCHTGKEVLPVPGG